MFNYQRVKRFAVYFQEKTQQIPEAKPLPLEDDLKNKNYWRVRGTWGLLQKYVQITLDCCHCCGPSSGWQSCLEMGQEPLECALPMYFHWCRFCTPVNSDARLC